MRRGRLFVSLSTGRKFQLSARVLIADTDAELRQRLSARLLEVDIFSDSVATAAEALEKLNELPYAVVVADVGLPNEGIELVIARIGGLQAQLRPIVLVLAARAEAARSLDVEIVQIVLRRPVEISQLVDLIRSCLRSSQPDPLAGGDGLSRGQVIS